MRYLAPIPLQFVDESGVPCSGGTVSVHYAGHNTLAPIYENSYNDELVDNPVVLDSFGMWKAYVDAGIPLDYIVMNDEGNVVASFLGVVAAGGNGGGTGGVTKAYVDENDNEIRASVGNLAADVADEVDRAEAAEKAAKTEVVGGENVTVEETLAPDGHSIFEVSSSGAPQQQSNWAQQDPSEPDYIKNKPSIPADKVFIFRDTEFNRTLVKAAWDAHKVVQMWINTPHFRTILTKVETPDADTEVYHFTAIVPVNRNQSTLNPTWRVFDAQFVYKISTGTYSSGGDSKDIVSPVQSDWNQSDTTALDYIKNKPDLGLKADKVQGATAGNLAALDASGNLTNSGKNATDFATDEQGTKADSAVQGVKVNGTELSKDSNNKVSIPDGTTTQKGVVQLNNAINSTSTTEAATPKAVKDAYDALNNKIVARAVFLSQQEWAAQSLLPGDPAKVYYVEDGTGEDAYTVYVWKESTSEYVEVDESSIDLDGYWHDGPTTTGNGNVVTGITLGNDGIPVLVKGITAASLDTNGDVPLEQIPDSVKDKIVYIDGMASLNHSTGVFALTVPNTTFTTISTVVNAGKLPVLRVTVNNGMSYLKLYYKGLMSNTSRQWHSFGSTDNQGNSPCTTDAKVFDNDEWIMIENRALNNKGNGDDVTVTPDGTSTGTDIGISTTLQVWAQKFKNLVGALKALAFKATVGTSDIDNDAITAAKVKDGETLPVNVSGKATSSYTLIGANMVSGTNGYSLLAKLELSNLNAVYAGAMFAVVCRGGSACFEGIVSVSLSEYTNSGNETAPIVGNVVVMNCRGENLYALTAKFDFYMLRTEAGKYQLYVYKKESGLPVSCTLLSATECSCTLYSSGAIANLPTAIETKKLNWICNKGVGSPTTPVYADSDGQVKPCGFQVNFGTPIAGTNVLNIVT